MGCPPHHTTPRPQDSPSPGRWGQRDPGWGHPRVSPYLCWERAELLPSIPTGRRRRSSRAAGLPYGSAPSRYVPTALQGDTSVPRPPPPQRAETPRTHSPAPPPSPTGAVPPLCHPPPQPALTALGVKPPGWHAGGRHGPGVRGQRDGQLDGAGQRHLRPVPGEEMDAESCHGRQLQPGGIGCRDKRR